MYLLFLKVTQYLRWLGFLASLCISSFAALPQVAPLFQASVGLPDVKVDHILEIGPLDANDEEMGSLTLWSPLVLFTLFTIVRCQV